MVIGDQHVADKISKTPLEMLQTINIDKLEFPEVQVMPTEIRTCFAPRIHIYQ